MAATTITIDGIVTRIESRALYRQQPGATRGSYQMVRLPLVTLSLRNGDSMDVPWAGETPALLSNWRLTVECIGEGDQCTGNG